jgi:hypothetical protein
MVIEVLAIYRAKKLVQDHIRRRGEKVSAYSAADIKTLSEAWVAEHKEELVAEAKRMIASSPELTKMYQKEERARAKLSTNAQTKIEPISKGSAVQISGAK